MCVRVVGMSFLGGPLDAAGLRASTLILKEGS